MLCRPKIAPVASIRSREPVVLNDDCDKEPLVIRLVSTSCLAVDKGTNEDNFPSENGFIERRNLSRDLAVVFR
jgi:hypothetical protein